jgi:hypothetical protein
MNDEFYQLPLSRLTQGDILRDVPSLFVPDPEITFLRKRAGPRGPVGDLYVLGDQEIKPQQAFNPDGDFAVASVQSANAILLTHSCELDNSPRAQIAFALIRSMAPLQEDAKSTIRSGGNRRLLYLPPNDDPELIESYVDLSRVTTIRRDAVPEQRRLLSLTEASLTALYFGLMRYFTRHIADEEAIAQLAHDALTLPDC